jgi:hypothetical protein
VWHRTSVEVMGSRTGEFPDPQHAMQGEDFGGLTRRSQELGGARLKGETVQTPLWGLEPRQ